jgi:hypothetical protein
LLLALVPGWKAMVESKSDLSGLVQRHFMLESASKLSERADTFMEPLITVDFVAARDWNSWSRWTSGDN